MSAELSWKRRGKLHIGRVVNGPADNERERQMRQRTYFIRRGDGMLKSKYYVRYRDTDDGQDSYSKPKLASSLGFTYLFFAREWAQAHLVKSPPKLRLKFVGRSEFGGELIWADKDAGSRVTLTLQYIVSADEFYGEMLR